MSPSKKRAVIDHGEFLVVEGVVLYVDLDWLSTEKEDAEQKVHHQVVCHWQAAPADIKPWRTKSSNPDELQSTGRVFAVYLGDEEAPCRIEEADLQPELLGDDEVDLQDAKAFDCFDLEAASKIVVVETLQDDNDPDWVGIVRLDIYPVA